MADSLVGLLVFILILGLVLGLCIYIIELFPFIPPEFKMAARAILLVIGLIILLVRVLPLAGVHVG